MITASSQIERIREPLPLVEADPEKQMELFQKSLHSLIKKQAVKVVSGQTIDFSEDIRHFVKTMVTVKAWHTWIKCTKKLIRS